MKKLLLSLFLAFASIASIFASGHVATATGTNSTCNGSCDGTATAMASGGIGPYGFTWTGPASYTATGANITSLCAGSYTVTAIDSSDMSTALYVLNITQPSPVAVTVNSPTICSGGAATLTATVSGGTAPYTYSWVASAGLSCASCASTTASPSVTTSYTITIVDANGSTGTAVSTVTVNPNPVVVANSGSTCAGNPFTIFASGAMTYLWSTGSTANPMVVNPATTTSYTVTGTSMGCVGTAVATVTVNPSLIASISSVTNSACGACDGSATVTPTGGTSPYSYLWTITGSTVSTAVGLCAATYTVTVTDAIGCTDAVIAIVNSSSGPSSALITTTNSSCIASTGQIDIGAVTGGVAPYQYSINGGAFTGTTSYTGLSTGIYTLGIQDVNGCIVNLMDTIDFANPPIITLDSINGITCSSGTTGNIFLTTTAGTPAYSFLWSNGSTTEDLTSIGTYGNYTLTVSDAAGCSLSQTYYISSAISVYGTASSTPINCGILGTATVNAYGGTPPYTFSWNTIPVQTTAIATGLTGGAYNCTITDAGGCSGNVFVTVPNLGCSNIIKGRVYDDINSNCIQDVGENGLSGRTVLSTPGYHYATTDVNGNYTISTPSMNNTVSVSMYSIPSLTPVCPVTGLLSVNFSTPGDTLTNNDFAYFYDPSFFNVGIHPGWTGGNPGFPKNYWVYPINNSPTSQNVLIRFVYDSNLVYTSSTMGGIHFPAQKKIEWTTTLPAGGYSLLPASRVDAAFYVPPTLSITSTLTSYFEILPIIGDAYPADNTLLITEAVTGCHDPNSKSVIPEGQGPNGNIFQSDSVLFYTIHFQNNGNDTAHFVVVTDTLSPFLDPASVIPGASSHPYTFDLSGEGILNFRFDNIMLPDSTTDEPGSNGYFNYTVKIKTGTPVGTVVNNTAHIYFDYNEAVVTNTTVNTIVDIVTSVESESSNSMIKVYPNPFSDNTIFVIQSDNLNEIYSFELTDVLGKKVKSKNGISEKQFEISRSGLENGIYFYKICTSESIVGIGKVIIK